MKKDDLDGAFFGKRFKEKTYIDVSICKSNIKEDTYYAKPCKTGFIKSEELLKRLKKKAPFVDEIVMMAACQQLSNLIVELISEGKTVDFFGLGSFSLGTKGKVDVQMSEKSYLEDESVDIDKLEGKSIDDVTSGGYNLDVSPIIKGKPRFTLNFEQSQIMKKTLENMDVSFAIKKKRAPTIASITNILTKSSSASNTELPMILQIKGEDLKVESYRELCGFEQVGSSEQVGIYIEESWSGKRKKIARENIIKNTPRELLIVLDEKLKDEKMYNLAILTQYVKMGDRRVAQLLRGTKVEFNTAELAVKKTSATIKKAILPFKRNRVNLLDLCLKKWESCETKKELINDIKHHLV